MTFSRYTLVGAMATTLHYVALVSLMQVPYMPTAMAAGVGALFGALFSYAGNRWLTFDSVVPHRVALPRFLLVAALSMALSAVLVGAMTALTEIHYLVPQMIASACVLVFGFHGNRLWSFR